MSDDSPTGYPADAPPMTMRQARMLDLRTYIWCAICDIFGITVTIEGLTVDSAGVGEGGRREYQPVRRTSRCSTWRSWASGRWLCRLSCLILSPTLEPPEAA